MHYLEIGLYCSIYNYIITICNKCAYNTNMQTDARISKYGYVIMEVYLDSHYIEIWRIPFETSLDIYSCKLAFHWEYYYLTIIEYCKTRNLQARNLCYFHDSEVIAKVLVCETYLNSHYI